MAKEEKLEKIWVASATGQPVHLVDKSLVRNSKDEPERIAISRQMVVEGVGVEVLKTPFIEKKITLENILKQLPDKVEAKKVYDEYMKKSRAEFKAKNQQRDEIEQIAHEAGKQVENQVRDYLKPKAAIA